MSPLEQLFTLEIEFHHRLRCELRGQADPALHTSYALQSRYEWLLRQIGRVTTIDLDRLTERLTLADDTRDVLAARAALLRLLSL